MSALTEWLQNEDFICGRIKIANREDLLRNRYVSMFGGKLTLTFIKTGLSIPLVVVQQDLTRRDWFNVSDGIEND